MSNRQFRRPRAISAPRSAGSTLFRSTAPMLLAFCELKSRPTSNVNGAVPRVAYSQSSLFPGFTWVALPSWRTWYPFAYAISTAKLLSRSSSGVGNRVYDQGSRTHCPALWYEMERTGGCARARSRSDWLSGSENGTVPGYSESLVDVPNPPEPHM